MSWNVRRDVKLSSEIFYLFFPVKSLFRNRQVIKIIIIIIKDSRQPSQLSNHLKALMGITQFSYIVQTADTQSVPVYILCGLYDVKRLCLKLWCQPCLSFTKKICYKLWLHTSSCLSWQIVFLVFLKLIKCVCLRSLIQTLTRLAFQIPLSVPSPPTQELLLLLLLLCDYNNNWSGSEGSVWGQRQDGWHKEPSKSVPPSPTNPSSAVWTSVEVSQAAISVLGSRGHHHRSNVLPCHLSSPRPFKV